MGTRRIVWLFGLLGTLPTVAVLAICLLARSAPPKLLARPDEAAQCAQTMLSRIQLGDYAGASAYLYGNPELEPGSQYSSAVSERIWNALKSSMQCELVGESCVTQAGIAQEACIRSLDIAGVTAALQQCAKALLEQRVEAAENMSEIYNDDFSYRDSFLTEVLQEAVDTALAEDGTYTEQTITLNLVYDQGQWLVIPDKALLGAISGGILG